MRLNAENIGAMPEMSAAEREACLAIVRDIRGAAGEEEGLNLLAHALVNAMSVAIERYGTGAYFERPERVSRGTAGVREEIKAILAPLSAEALEKSREC